MKIKNSLKGLFLGLSSILVLGSCSDFLEKYPLDAMSDKNYFTKETDLKYYMNGVYGGIIRNQGNDRWGNLNVANDDWIFNNVPAPFLMQHSNSGIASETNSGWNSAYDYLRKINYLIHNAYNVPSLTAIGKHYLGEGYFCRAFKYFELLKKFGGVPYIDNVLNVDSKDLYRPRDSREFIAERILADLDSAIVCLNWKGEGEAKSGRINKESALLMKSRVALYEGSWEYYHGRKNTPFAVKGSNGTSFLQQVEGAVEMLNQKHGGNLYKGQNGKEYFNLFNQNDYEKVSSAFLYKIYDLDLGFTTYWEQGLCEGCHGSLTKKAVDAYLMLDGKPAEISSIHMNNETMNELCSHKDPRLHQTIWCPSNGLFSDRWPGSTHGYKTSYPGLIQNQQRNPAYSGYRIVKGAQYNTAKVNAGQVDDTDDIILRYEEALLNYAEAKAILGTLTQDDLDHSINYIRARVGMPAMNLAEVNGWNITYSVHDGYDPSADNVLNEIRRERRVEFMIEGLRLDDLKRWAILEDVFNGWKPVGAPVQEYLDYWNNEESVLAEGFDWVKPEQVKLIQGVNYDVIDGCINPFFKHADFKVSSGRGYFIEPSRDYLESIPLGEITLYKDKAGVELQQNPGWF